MFSLLLHKQLNQLEMVFCKNSLHAINVIKAISCNNKMAAAYVCHKNIHICNIYKNLARVSFGNVPLKYISIKILGKYLQNVQALIFTEFIMQYTETMGNTVNTLQ